MPAPLRHLPGRLQALLRERRPGPQSAEHRVQVDQASQVGSPFVLVRLLALRPARGVSGMGRREKVTGLVQRPFRRK